MFFFRLIDKAKLYKKSIKAKNDEKFLNIIVKKIDIFHSKCKDTVGYIPVVAEAGHFPLASQFA